MRTLVHCFLVFSCMLFMGGCAKVQTGTRVTCKNCHKVIQDTVHEVTVPFWQAQQFSISTEETYCKECGDQLVVYKTHYLCKKCGQEFKTEEFSAPRREERSDQTVSNQYCETCGNESVSYKVVHLCKNCGNIVSTENLFAPRFEERKDAEKSDSICTLCARRAKMEGIGEQIGNAIGGFFDGVGKGANRR